MKASEVDRILELSGEALVAALTDLVEGQYLERKSGRVSAKDLAVPLVAMANSEGGVIVVGLHGGQPDGVPEGKVNDLRQASLDHTEPPVRCSVDEREVPGSDGVARTLLILRVDPSESMHRLTNGTVYLRVGDESKKLSAAQSQELAYDRGAVMYEAAPVRMEVADLDGSQLEAYRSVLGASTVESMLRARDLVDRQGSVTTAPRRPSPTRSSGSFGTGTRSEAPGGACRSRTAPTCGSRAPSRHRSIALRRPSRTSCPSGVS